VADLRPFLMPFVANREITTLLQQWYRILLALSMPNNQPNWMSDGSIAVFQTYETALSKQMHRLALSAAER